jgi:hypothetical protein
VKKIVEQRNDFSALLEKQPSAERVADAIR